VFYQYEKEPLRGMAVTEEKIRDLRSQIEMLCREYEHYERIIHDAFRLRMEAAAKRTPTATAPVAQWRAS
jgi:hypothetical protein